MQVIGELRDFFRAALVTPVTPVPDDDPAIARRRRVIVFVSLVAGTAGLGWALSIDPGDSLFCPATLLVAALWCGGAFLSGPLHRGKAHTREGSTSSRGIVQGFILGGLLLAFFLLGAVIVAPVDALRGPVDDLLDHGTYGNLAIVLVVTAISGICEELFFRGAVYAALPARVALLGSTLLYALSTVLSGVPLLTFAALSVGLLAGAQRRVTGGIAGPVVSHITWSVGMLLLLPHALTIGDELW